MIKLNIQLFGGGANEWDGSDGDKDGYVQVPYRGQTINIPIESVTKLGSGWTLNSNKAKNATVYIQYYLETGKGPSSNEAVRSWIEGLSEEEKTNIGITLDPAGLSNANAHFDSSEVVNELIPAVRKAIENNQVFYRDAQGQQVYIDPEEITQKTMPGYVNGLGLPVGKDATGKYVYSSSGGGVVNVDGVTPQSYTNHDGVVFNKGVDGSYIDASGNVDSSLIKDNTPTNLAFNEYYNDIMNTNQPGTLGYQMLQNNVNLFRQEADNAGMLAEASMQSQALAQAQTTRQVVDSLRNERMSQLRAGMNEAQLADRELQLLIGSSQQMAGQNQMARQGALEASMGQSTAYEQAFNQYIEQASVLGQNAAANYAAASGDVIRQSQAYIEFARLNGRARADEVFGLVSGREPQ